MFARFRTALGRFFECVALLGIVAGSVAAGERDDRHPAPAPVHAPALAPRADEFSVGPGWMINLGVAYADTFSYPMQAVLPVAAAALIRDGWRIRTSDVLPGRIVTEWQPVRHLFVRLFCGEVRERSIVDVTRIDDRRCLVKFRAALATRKSLVGNPLMPRIRKEYETGVRDWQRKLRISLAERARKK